MKTLDEVVRDHTRPALCLISKPFHDGATCFSGGAPTLPDGMAWPQDSRGVPCIFLAQFDLAALPFQPEGWPEAGTLFVFLASVIDDLYLVETGEPFLYYAGPNARLVEQWRPTPLAEREFFQYAWGRDPYKSPPPMHDTFGLPKRALSFVPFEDLNVSAMDLGVLSEAELADIPEAERIWRCEEAAYKLPKEQSAAYFDVLTAVGAQKDERRKAAYRAGYGLPETDANYGPSYATKAVIDPELAMWKTQFNTDHESTKAPPLPCHIAFPSTPEMIYRHAMWIWEYLCGDFATPDPPTPVGQGIANEAQSWAERARNMRGTDVSAEDKKAYLAWCRDIYARCLAQHKRRFLDDPPFGEKAPFIEGLIRRFLPRMRIVRREQDRMSCYGLLDKIGELHDPCYDTIAAMPPEVFDVLAAEDRAVIAPEYATNTVNQMFGYGFEIQSEVRQFKDKTLVFSTFGGEHIHFGGGTFNIWLAEDSLIPDAWQKVIVANPAS